MTAAGPEADQDPELLAEQEHLDHSHQALVRMRSRAEGLLQDVRGAGTPDLDYQAALAHRVRVRSPTVRARCSSAGSTRRPGLRGTSGDGMSRTSVGSPWSSTGGHPSPCPSIEPGRRTRSASEGDDR